MFKPVVIAFCIDPARQDAGKGAGVFVTVASLWTLLCVFRMINSRWPLLICGDASYKISAQAVALLG